METLRTYLRRYFDGPIVRPFGLAGPILVLLITLPLLRPLRHPSETEISTDETLRLATIRALVEHRSLELDKSYAKVPGAVTLKGHVYSAQPPMMSLLLSVPARILNRLGFTFQENQPFVAYWLTLLGAALPAAAVAGLIYRMGRIFELKRPWRTLLAFSTVAASGLLSYAVVLNAHVPAAALVIASAACLFHVAGMDRDRHVAGWMVLAGACAALAAALNPPAVIFLILFVMVIPAMRLSPMRRAAGVLLYIIGVLPILWLHSSWNRPITGDLIPLSVHTALNGSVVTPVVWVPDDLDDDQQSGQSFWSTLGSHLLWCTNAAFGTHGLFSHFPVLIVSIFGIAAVMHRHWPGSTKMLAGATAAASITIVTMYRVVMDHMARADWSAAMFANQWFILFAPLLLFWSGAWLRRKHSTLKISLAGAALAYSIAVGIIGATGPMPRHGFEGYTAADALDRWIHPQPLPVGPLAGRRL